MPFSIKNRKWEKHFQNSLIEVHGTKYKQTVFQSKRGCSWHASNHTSVMEKSCFIVRYTAMKSTATYCIAAQVS